MNCSMNLGVKPEVPLAKGYQWPHNLDKARLDKILSCDPKTSSQSYSRLESGKNDLGQKKFKVISYIKQNDIIRVISNLQEKK